jgi:putative oxidoreductase
MGEALLAPAPTSYLRASFNRDPSQMPNSQSVNAALLVGRVLLAVIFLVSGLGKLSDPAGTMGYMQQAGLPGILVWPTIAVEVLGALAIIAGFQTAVTALVLAVFTLLAALFFHLDFGNQIQFVNFMKNLAITGGFLVLAAAGPGQWSLDARRGAVPVPSRG